MKEVFLCVFIFVSLFHLAAAFFGMVKPRKISKLFLMPLLTAYCIAAARGYIYVPVLFALTFAFFGDFFLLEIDKPLRFMLGLASFLIGHLCYIPAFISLTADFHIPVLIVSYIVASVLGFFIVKTLKPARNMLLPVILYTLVILSMSIFALQMMITLASIWSIVVFAGSLLFIASDTMLAFFTFGTIPKQGDFLVMLFYISAQACIVIGLSRLWGKMLYIAP